MPAVQSLVEAGVISALQARAGRKSTSVGKFQPSRRCVQHHVICRRASPRASRPGQRITAIRIEDPGLVAELEQHQVTAIGGIPSNWRGILLWLAPFGVLMLLWNVTLSRAGQVQGAAAFGRSGATIYAETDVKVTLADVAGIDEAIDD